MSDLFSADSTTIREHFKPLIGSWSDIFNIDTLERVETTLAEVGKRSILAKVYPESKDIFKIYQTPIEKIKVVIIAQDPYHDDNAMGYAFGCKTHVSPSLKQILKAMWDDHPNKTFLENKDMELQYLVEQGVFLLNTVLTVEAGNPKSHEYIGWQDFTKATIELIAKRNKNIVWMLWGKSAQGFAPIISNISKDYLILQNEHPAAAAHRNQQWICSHFSECNKYLIDNQIKPIDWL